MDGVACSPHAGASGHRLKLKAMEIPKFSGKRGDWASFRSVWVNIIEHQGFSNFVLAQQLKLAVKSSFAEQLIKAIEITSEDSYHYMWQRLANYYEDISALITALNNELGNLKSVRQGGPRDIIDFVNSVEIVHEKLYSLSEDYPARLEVSKIDRLVRCLPGEMEVLWNRIYYDFDFQTKQSPFTEFVKFLDRERSLRLRFIDVADIRTPRPKPAESHHAETEAATQRRKSDRGPGAKGGDKPRVAAKCWIDTAHTGHWTRQCRKWKEMNPVERRQICFKLKKCITCLESFGRGHTCNTPQEVIDKFHCKSCKTPHRGDIACTTDKKGPKPTGDPEEGPEFECGSMSARPYTARYSAQVQGVRNSVPLFCDDGSDLSFVEERFAKEERLKSVARKTLRVKTLHGCKKIQCEVYEVPIVTKDSIENALCHSVNKTLTGPVTPVDLQEIQKIFPLYKNIGLLERDPSPAVILLGLDNYHLHPNRLIASKGNLTITRGKLGDTIIGSQDDGSSCDFSAYTYYISKGEEASLAKFISGEELGTEVSPRCGNCRCGKCPISGHTFSFKEEQELELIRMGLKFNEEARHWHAQYPWVKDPAELPENRYLALATLKSTERTLAKDPLWASAYKDQVKDMLDRDACRKLSPRELEEWEGPKFYISHLAIQNPKSSTTPMRIVFNSSQECKGSA